MQHITAIMVDQREPTWVQELSFGGADKVVTLLDEGDLLVACADGALLCVERKTADDLLASIQDGRLLNQAGRMASQTPWSYVVITGTLERSHDGKVVTQRGVTGWSWHSVQGALLTVQEMGVHVIHAGSDEDYERVVLGLAKRNRVAVPLWPTRPAKWLSPGEQVIASLPGIGTERLSAVLAAYQTPAQALCYLTDPNLNGHVPGIGSQTRANIRQALKLAPGESLIVVNDEKPNFKE